MKEQIGVPQATLLYQHMPVPDNELYEMANAALDILCSSLQCQSSANKYSSDTYTIPNNNAFPTNSHLLMCKGSLTLTQGQCDQ